MAFVISDNLISLDKFDIKVIDMRWGDCPQNGLSKEEEHLRGYFFNPQEGLPKQPDVFIQISVPNEFRPMGKYNIGITAGMETTAVSAYRKQKFSLIDFISDFNYSS